MEKELRIKMYFLSMIQTVYGQPIANNVLNFVIFEAFPLKSRINEGWMKDQLLLFVILDVLVNETRNRYK